MHKIIWVIVGLSLGMTLAVWAGSVTRLAKPHTAPVGQAVLKNTATSTEYVQYYTESELPTEFPLQGSCLVLREKGGAAKLFVFASAGSLASSAAGCGI